MLKKKHIVMFYGETCPYCLRAEPVVALLEEEGVASFERLEVWSNEENASRMNALKHLYDEACGGNMVVPSFYDRAKERLICNPGSYDNLKRWIEGG